MPAAEPTTRTVLAALTKTRLGELAREAEIHVAPAATKDAYVTAVADAGRYRFADLLGRLGRDELRAACRAHRLDDASRARPTLMARLLQAHGAADSVPPATMFAGRDGPADVPTQGAVVRCRHRQWLVERATPAINAGDATRVALVCLDDDHQGRRLEVLWELELGARVLRPERQGLGDEITHLDPPRYFGAYLHALKWNAVTATDPKLLQAPFRAGIQLLDHQLAPLRRALVLPHANLFIADDVGLGKTIEAGLVLQELLLRQRIDLVLVVCPPSVALQWRDEMRLRFGLNFDIYNRELVAEKRRERGFGVNAWTTGSRFIVSYQTLRRPEHRDPLLARLGDRATKSLLVLDEAHVAAPSSAGRYATDSRITSVVRDIAPRFENRLFLSATPHNGHSNSFSALLELLDPQRFTRAVDVSPKALDEVMVRRLKEDLRRVARASFPRRDVVRVALTHADGQWSATTPSTATVDLGAAAAPELELSRLLAAYSALARPKKGQGQLVFINLQKRLLSSIDAFHRTLDKHATRLAQAPAPAAPPADAPTLFSAPDDDERGIDEAALDAAEDDATVASTALVATPDGRARALLDQMLDLARRERLGPDAKARALLDWIRKHQCAAAQFGGPPTGTPRKDKQWSDTRVIVFTEYTDTRRWLQRLLETAIDGTDRAEKRLMVLQGGMSDVDRAEVQQAFQAPPSEHPVRILLATDAAREGVNLQAHCEDLFHFDIPWNPARMEQRNGRIDRTMQPAEVVRCHYFAYPDRAEDAVLETLVGKIETIRKELGSLGTVLMEHIDATLSLGIDDRTLNELKNAEAARPTVEIVKAELERTRQSDDVLRAELDEAGQLLERSRAVLDFDPALLREAIDVGLELAGVGGKLVEEKRGESWSLPPMPDSWQQTLDALRSPRAPDEPLWDWRKRPLPAVTFRAPKTLDDQRAHLHLSHPLVARVLSRFRAQGFSAHDLSRVTVLRSSHDHVPRAVAFGRLSLFGTGAGRLHDELVVVAAQWLESRGKGHLDSSDPAADRRARERIEQLLAEAPELDTISAATRDLLRASAKDDFATLWKHVTDEAEARAVTAKDALRRRGQAEAEALRKILIAQRTTIERSLRARPQMELPFETDDVKARVQWESETRHLERRLESIATEVEREPVQVAALYDVVYVRLEPVGLVYIWPETRG